MIRTKIYTLASVIVVVFSVTCFYYLTRAQDEPESIIFTASEMREFTPSDILNLKLEFRHVWGNAKRSRKIIITGSGDFVIYDWQHATPEREGVLSGELPSSYFAPSELEMVMRDNVDYELQVKGQIGEEVIKQILMIIADAVDGNYALSPTTGDFLSETLSVTLSFSDKGIEVIEEVNMDYHDPIKLQALFGIEQLLEGATSKVEVEEISRDEYTDFSLENSPHTREAYNAQWKLRWTKAEDN